MSLRPRSCVDVWPIAGKRPPPERSLLFDRRIWCMEASVMVEDLYFCARLLVVFELCVVWVLAWNILFIFLYWDWVDDTELYFCEHSVLSPFCAEEQQTASLPDDVEDEFDVTSAFPLPPELPSGGDLGGCK